jgi:transposase
MRDYTTKTVFIGIDVHKKTYAVTAVCEGQVIKKDSLKAVPSVLIAYCKKYFIGAKIESAYEAGFSGFHLHRCLLAAGIQNRVVDAASIEVAAGNRVKTDKRDSLKIATQLSQGRLRAIHVPTEEREDNRAITRLRNTFVEEKTRVGNQLKALLYQHGLIPADKTQKVSIKWIESLKALEVLSGLKYAIGHYASLWLHMDIEIKKIDKEIEVQACKDSALEEVYKSVPGIGPTSARVLANELGDTSQFNNERQLFSYVGLTPTEHSSGEHVRQGHITKRGKPILRKIFTQVAWMAIRRDTSLMEIYLRLAKKAGGKKAIIGVARRIAGRIRACFRRGELYCSKIMGARERQDSNTLVTISLT